MGDEFDIEKYVKAIKSDSYEDGVEAGIAVGAKGIIGLCEKLSISYEDTVRNLQTQLNISLQKAEEYMNRFGKIPA